MLRAVFILLQPTGTTLLSLRTPYNTAWGEQDRYYGRTSDALRERMHAHFRAFNDWPTDVIIRPDRPDRAYSLLTKSVIGKRDSVNGIDDILEWVEYQLNSKGQRGPGLINVLINAYCGGYGTNSDYWESPKKVLTIAPNPHFGGGDDSWLLVWNSDDLRPGLKRALTTALFHQAIKNDDRTRPDSTHALTAASPKRFFYPLAQLADIFAGIATPPLSRASKFKIVLHTPPDADIADFEILTPYGIRRFERQIHSGKLDIRTFRREQVKITKLFRFTKAQGEPSGEILAVGRPSFGKYESLGPHLFFRGTPEAMEYQGLSRHGSRSYSPNCYYYRLEEGNAIFFENWERSPGWVQSAHPLERYEGRYLEQLMNTSEKLWQVDAAETGQANNFTFIYPTRGAQRKRTHSGFESSL